jgi:hypothetical protein
MARTRELLFKVFYSSSFTVVFLLLIAFVGVAPADKLYESYRRRRVIDIIIIAAAWVLTALIAAFLYGTRLYTNRSILRDIPKTFLPIEGDDLPGRYVHRMVQENYICSAVVAYQARPRSRRIEIEVEGAGERMLTITKRVKHHRHRHSLTGEEIALLDPSWGPIEHSGWQSPTSSEIPNLEYARVADELIDLVEAKAVSMAPRDPFMTLENSNVPAPDQQWIDSLARYDNTSMRRYLAQLADLGLFSDPSLTDDFLRIYEYERYSGRPLQDVEFQLMMRLFAELLRSMQAPVADMVDWSDDDLDEQSARIPSNFIQRSSSPQSSHSAFSGGSVVHKAPKGRQPPRRVSEDSVPSMSTGSLDMQERSGGTRYVNAHSSVPIQQSTSTPTTALGRGSYPWPNLRQAQSYNSFRSAATSRSSTSNGTQGSVIRLVTEEASNRDIGEGLPYEINVNGFGPRSRDGVGS